VQVLVSSHALYKQLSGIDTGAMTVPDSTHPALARARALNFAMLMLVPARTGPDHRLDRAAVDRAGSAAHGPPVLGLLGLPDRLHRCDAAAGAAGQPAWQPAGLLGVVTLFLLRSLLCGPSREMDALFLAPVGQGASGDLLTLAMTSVTRLFQRETAP
jgi:hypothetical protein